MDIRKNKIRAAFAVSGTLLFVPIGSASASGKFSAVSALTEWPKVSVQYGKGAIDALEASPASCDKALNTGNGGDVFRFSSCGFPDAKAPSFQTDNELLNLWQVGREDVRAEITNKAKFGIYSSLFKAMENSYEVDNPGTGHTDDFAWQDAEIEKMKNGIADAYLLPQTGKYKANAFDFLWRTPEMAPKAYYSDGQKESFQKFEKSATTLVAKLGAVKNRKTLAGLEKALAKTLKDPKSKMENDRYALLMVAYAVVAEKLGHSVK